MRSFGLSLFILPPSFTFPLLLLNTAEQPEGMDALLASGWAGSKGCLPAQVVTQHVQVLCETWTTLGMQTAYVRYDHTWAR